MTQLTPEEKLILASVKIQPDSDEMEYLNALILQVTDWEYLVTVVINRGIGPLLFKKLPHLSNNKFIPETVKQKLQQVYYKTFSRSAIFYDRFSEIANAFRSKNIDLIALKGIYLSDELYGDIGLRQFSDIDLLVREKDAEKSLEILKNADFKSFENDEDELSKKLEVIHFSPLIKNGVSVEIHVKLHLNIEKYHVNVDDLWKNAIKATINNQQVFVLNGVDQLIHTCVHLDKHFNQGHIQFTGFNDITNLLEQIDDEFYWINFISSCKLYNCEQSALTYLLLANKYMHAKLPETIIQNYRYLLTNKVQNLFTDYLRGSVGFTTGMPKHFSNFQYLTNNKDRLIYLWRILFPSRVFMINKFKIQNTNKLLLYYPYRFWLGVKGVIKLLVHSGH